MISYFISTLPTPLLNTRDFKAVFGGNNGSLPFDDKKLVRALEMVALPQTSFKVIKRYDPFILEVQTAEYPSLRPLYLDKRFGQEETKQPPMRKKIIPSREEMIEQMRKRVGKPYIWGGNYAAGIPELMTYYPPPSGKILDALERITWTFQGVDCSGLLYEVSNGALPRNTDKLLFIGRGVAISHLSWEEIAKALQPLDLLIWKGHLAIVLDGMSIIESHHEWGGVCLTSIEKRLRFLRDIDQKRGVDNPIEALRDPTAFLVRRFVF